MDPTSDIFSHILTPLAIYANDPEPGNAPEVGGSANDAPPPIPTRSSIKSDTALKETTWRLDGVDIDGVRFFAVPTFAINAPPLRIDVYIPPLEDHSNLVRQVLKPEEAIYNTKKSTALNLDISEHLLRSLDHWSSSFPNFKYLYRSVPFGSQIVVPELTVDPITTASTIQLVDNYVVEQAMLPLNSLQHLWPSTITWPPTIDTTSLSIHSQIHEAITLVTIPSSPLPSRQYVFKSLLRDQKYLYNELRMLLTVPPHPNLIPRPLYVVTHKCRFGGKRGVAGFVLEYYPLGSLATTLSSPPTLLKHSLSDRFRWAKQITSALIHINTSGQFYPDLKPDNVVLRENVQTGQTDAVLLDLEQRGGWFSWSPPEVRYVEYIEILASRAPDRHVREEMTALLRRYIPTWSPPAQEQRYTDVSGGFSAPWLALARLRDAGIGPLAKLLDRAQSFMLGKLLWCIFEGRAVVRCGIDHELLRDPDPEGLAFPEFKETPDGVRELIRACTAGAGEWEGRRRGVVLREGKLVPEFWDGKGQMPSAWDTREVAREWWAEEVQRAKEFLCEIVDVRNGDMEPTSGVIGSALERPLLGELLAELGSIESRELQLAI